jgi:hypothetical protein
METVAIAFSPAFQALPFAILMQLQMLSWLKQDFNCTDFKIVTQDADVWVFMNSELDGYCGYLAYGEYFGCYYGSKVFIHDGLFGKKGDFSDWHYAYQYRRKVLKHEFQHHFLPTHVHQGNEDEVYRENYC